MEKNDPPVNVGDVVKVKIEGIGEKGDGIAKVQKYVLIIPDTKQDEECEVKVTKILRKFGFAEKVNTEGATTDTKTLSSDTTDTKTLSSDTTDTASSIDTKDFTK